jgi:hypothetical protein
MLLGGTCQARQVSHGLNVCLRHLK